MTSIGDIKLSKRLSKYLKVRLVNSAATIMPFAEDLVLEEVIKDRNSLLNHLSTIRENMIDSKSIISLTLEYYYLSYLVAFLTDKNDKLQHIIPKCYIKHFGEMNDKNGKIYVSKFYKYKKQSPEITDRHPDFRGEKVNQDFSFEVEEFLALIERDYSKLLQTFISPDVTDGEYVIDDNTMLTNVSFLKAKIVVSCYVLLLQYRTTDLRTELTKEEFHEAIKYSLPLGSIIDLVGGHWGWISLSEEDFTFTTSPVIVEKSGVIETTVIPLGRSLGLLITKNGVYNPEATLQTRCLPKSFIATNHTTFRDMIKRHNARYDSFYCSGKASKIIC